MLPPRAIAACIYLRFLSTEAGVVSGRCLGESARHDFRKRLIFNRIKCFRKRPALQTKLSEGKLYSLITEVKPKVLAVISVIGIKSNERKEQISVH